MKKIIISFLLVAVVVSMVTTVNAGFLDEVFKQSSGFGNSSGKIATKITDFLKNDIIPAIGTIGNLVFAGVTLILGMKYIWSGAEGKAQVSETLPAFVLGIIFFYLAETLLNWFTGATSGISSANDWADVQDRVWWLIYTIVRVGAFGGILFLGLKYMFSSAEGRARVKTNFVVVALGLMFVFSASSVVNYIVDVSRDVLQ